jgi:hypothetical protein
VANVAMANIRKELTQDTISNFTTDNINWIPQPQRFGNWSPVTEVRVLNLIDMPYQIKEKKRGDIGYFLVNDSLRISKEQLKETLKKKYGYYKVRLRNAEWWEVHGSILETSKKFNSKIAVTIGDSVWMKNELADKFQLKGTASRMVFRANYGNSLNTISASSVQASPVVINRDVFNALQNRYGVDITSLGWINCDRFYNDPRPKIQYAVDLGDDAKNYYTMLLFENVKSMMSGNIDGNKVFFYNLPEGEKVTIISIGINKANNTVYTAQPAIINNQGLTDLKFQTTSATELKNSLSKMDK